MQAATEFRALTAVLFGHVDGVEARRVERSQRLVGEPRLFVDVGGVRSDLLLRQGADRRPEFLVFLRQLEKIE